MFWSELLGPLHFPFPRIVVIHLLVVCSHPCHVDSCEQTTWQTDISGMLDALNRLTLPWLSCFYEAFRQNVRLPLFMLCGLKTYQWHQSLITHNSFILKKSPHLTGTPPSYFLWACSVYLRCKHIDLPLCLWITSLIWKLSCTVCLPRALCGFVAFEAFPCLVYRHEEGSRFRISPFVSHVWNHFVTGLMV